VAGKEAADADAVDTLLESAGWSECMPLYGLYIKAFSRWIW